MVSLIVASVDDAGYAMSSIVRFYVIAMNHANLRPFLIGNISTFVILCKCTMRGNGWNKWIVNTKINIFGSGENLIVCEFLVWHMLANRVIEVANYVA